MNTLCITSCGKRKIWDDNPKAGPTAARNTYIGPFTRKCMQYAERFYPTSWCILSAKYGFLLPDDKVPENYSATFNFVENDRISLEELSRQAIRKKLDAYGKIAVLGGKRYVEVVQEVFPNKQILVPLRGLRGIGYMMREMKRAIGRGIPI